MIPSATRILTTTLLATGLLFLAPAANANDGGVDARDGGTAGDDAGKDAGKDDSGATSDDTGAAHGVDASAPHGCIANGEPCNQSETCCLEESYCGGFGGTGASLVCGSNSSNALSTSTCAVAHDAGLDVVWLVSAVGLVVVLRRRRRSS